MLIVKNAVSVARVKKWKEDTLYRLGNNHIRSLVLFDSQGLIFLPLPTTQITLCVTPTFHLMDGEPTISLNSVRPTMLNGTDASRY